jgi:hypothetical protein
MTSITRSTFSGPESSPQQLSVRKVQRIQQRIIALNTQYSHVLGGFNLALERLSKHLMTARPPQAEGRPWDASTAGLAAPVDRLALELEGLTRKLDDMVQDLSASREELGILLGLRWAKPVHASAAPADPAAGIASTGTAMPAVAPSRAATPGVGPEAGKA